MHLRFTTRLIAAAAVGFVLFVPGCNRSTVVVPEQSSAPEEHTVVRAKLDTLEATHFELPDDEGGKLLAKLLPPKQPSSETVQETKPTTRKASSLVLQLPTLPLPTADAALPRLIHQASSGRTYPHLEMDETLGVLLEMPGPTAPALPTQKKIRVDSRDVNEPLALPILGTAVMERASLEDPTLEQSTASAVAASIPARTAKAPFLKLTIPDPYDGRRSELPPLMESREFPLGTPSRPPR